MNSSSCRNNSNAVLRDEDNSVMKTVMRRESLFGTNTYGVKLDTILRSRPADMAGVKEGDIVVEFDGVPIRTSDEFLMRVRRALPYSTVKVVVMRGEGDVKEKIEIPVKMGKQ